MNRLKKTRPRRWFMISLIGMFFFLCGGIILAAVLLLQRGKLPKTGLITGSSMEPIFRGPRFLWTCPSCSAQHSFALDTCKSLQPFVCKVCNKLDRVSEFDFADKENLAGKTHPGTQVRFATLRAIRKSRAIDIQRGLTQSSGLGRGDVVVIEESLGAMREVKRVVGFPMERVEIDQGDIFVDDLRWAKTLEQSLRQSILINAWDGAKQSLNPMSAERFDGIWSFAGSPFSGVLTASADGSAPAATTGEITFDCGSPPYLDNRLAVNAHDSHAIVPVQDFGVAFQLTNVATSWQILCKFRCDIGEPQVDLRWNGVKLTIQSEDQVANVEISQRKENATWVVLAMIDGFLVVGSQDEEWLRRALPGREGELQMTKTEWHSPIAIRAVTGTLSVDQLLVFRDIYYRGNGDSGRQAWPSSNQVIVLGDNVSASSDSRDRWPDGLPLHAIKGVVLQLDSPMETLLRQR